MHMILRVLVPYDKTYGNQAASLVRGTPLSSVLSLAFTFAPELALSKDRTVTFDLDRWTSILPLLSGDLPATLPRSALEHLR
jgi:hypothetical protein